MNILITGGNGQLGSEIKALAASYPSLNLIVTDFSKLDICNNSQLNNFIENHKIEAIINCAAYTNVDKAESDFIKAQQVNDKGVANLVQVISNVDGKLIHISTDYVFDGTNHTPYTEDDLVHPLGVYGKTKALGEQHVINNDCNGIVIRTSWLYSSFGNNFVKTMMRLGEERKQLGVIFDQIGTPTYAGDLAKTCLEIVKNFEILSNNGKVYHFSNEGVASWYDFAKAIMELADIDCNVLPIESKEYPTAAKRPFYSVLNKQKIKSDFNVKIPYWKDALQLCINKIKK